MRVRIPSKIFTRLSLSLRPSLSMCACGGEPANEAMVNASLPPSIPLSLTQPSDLQKRILTETTFVEVKTIAVSMTTLHSIQQHR